MPVSQTMPIWAGHPIDFEGTSRPLIDGLGNIPGCVMLLKPCHRTNYHAEVE